jgi:DNA primase
MQSIPNQNRSIGGSALPSKDGAAKIPPTNQQIVKDLIRQANTVPIPVIMKHYGIRLNAQNNVIVCPFQKHKNGKESTASFNYYPENNTYWCYGCKSGRDAVNLVANLDNISMGAAARKIVNQFGNDICEDNIEVDPTFKYSECVEIYMDFANFIRHQLQSNSDDQATIEHIEKITLVFDKMNEKYQLNIDALKSLTQKLKEKIVK